MQEIKKSRIVIASVLKPVDETRMFEKIGLSLAREYEVHIIGYPTLSKTATTEIYTHPLPRFNRISFQRIFSWWKIFRIAFTLHPKIFIFTTHELLVTAILLKLLRGCKIIYDVQENYFRNILHTEAFPVFIRPFLATYVRIKEWLFTPFVDHFFLAEKTYGEEMSFLKKRKTTLENKYKVSAHAWEPKKNTFDGKIHLLFSGTLSSSTGVFNAITLADILFEHEPLIHLTIIGYCPLKKEYQKLLREIDHKTYITLTGGDQLIPHPEILRHIITSDFGVIAYPENPATVNAIPTKLYEYTGNQLPILLIHNDRWVKFCEPCQAAIPFDINRIDANEILQKMRETPFYTSKPIEVFWDSEEKKLLEILRNLKF